MEITDDLKVFSERIETLKDTVQTEEATKMSLIVPFFQLLGYDVFNPVEFCPEYTADVGIKKGEKVDYAILLNNEPVILIEAKCANRKLDKHSSQLFRYFVTTSAKFAILTNGIIYKFYTDLEEANKMDKDPFMEIDLLHITNPQIKQLEKFQKKYLNISDILDTASVLKYNTLFIKGIEQQFTNPSDDFVKLFLQPIYRGTKTQSVIEKFRPILKKALADYINENVNDKIKFALNSTSACNINPTFSTDEEWESITIIKEILKDIVDVNLISYKYTESYIAVLYQNNTRKWICRLYLASSQKIIAIPDENKKEQKYPIQNITNLHDYSEAIKTSIERYTINKENKNEVDNKLYTKWGVYEMPDPYIIDLSRGPRKDLKRLQIK